MFEVNNNASTVSIVDFEQVNICWERGLYNIFQALQSAMKNLKVFS